MGLTYGLSPELENTGADILKHGDEIAQKYRQQAIDEFDKYLDKNGYESVMGMIKPKKRTLVIWKKRYRPFAFGNPHENIKTEIDTPDIIDIGKGFKAVFIENAGVFELTSGALVGDTIEKVQNDIASCDDIKMMVEQVENAVLERENAKLVSYAEFFE